MADLKNMTLTGDYGWESMVRAKSPIMENPTFIISKHQNLPEKMYVLWGSVFTSKSVYLMVWPRIAPWKRKIWPEYYKFAIFTSFSPILALPEQFSIFLSHFGSYLKLFWLSKLQKLVKMQNKAAKVAKIELITPKYTVLVAFWAFKTSK